MFVASGTALSDATHPGFVAKYRYYPRLMDGVAPRTVERFIRAKSR
jgi:hypothetical protein